MPYIGLKAIKDLAHLQPSIHDGPPNSAAFWHRALVCRSREYHLEGNRQNRDVGNILRVALENKSDKGRIGNVRAAII